MSLRLEYLQPGTRTIRQQLLRQSEISLTVVINAYGDGHSTGRMRVSSTKLDRKRANQHEFACRNTEHRKR